MVFHFYLPNHGRKLADNWDGTKAAGDNFYVQIFTDAGDTNIWTGNLLFEFDNSMKVNTWQQVVMDLSDPGWRGPKIDKSTIKKITICEYDDYILYIDDIFFANSDAPQIPE